MVKPRCTTLYNICIVFTRLIPVLHDVVAGAKAENGHLYLIYAINNCGITGSCLLVASCLIMKLMYYDK